MFISVYILCNTRSIYKLVKCSTALFFFIWDIFFNVLHAGHFFILLLLLLFHFTGTLLDCKTVLALVFKLLAKSIIKRLAMCVLILVYNCFTEGIRIIYVRLE